MIKKRNAKWRQLVRSRGLYIEPRAILSKHSKVFCIGSCFAVEIKRTLRKMNYCVHPADDPLKIALSDGKVYVPTERQLMHYNTYCILQEFEKALDLWRQPDDDYWVVRDSQTDRYLNGSYQDPYRNRVSARTHEDILCITREFDRVLREGILQSDVYIVTLGLTEVWRKKDNGRVAGVNPRYLSDEIAFERSTFEENYANMKRMAELIGTHFPGRQIVLSVSPVPMSMTFSDEDVMVANMESKAVLRAVATRIAREYPNVTYFPSYEMCTLFEKFKIRPVYKSDARHVLPETVASIIESFLEHFSSDGPEAARAVVPPKHPFFFMERLFRRMMSL